MMQIIILFIDVATQKAVAFQKLLLDCITLQMFCIIYGAHHSQ